MKILSHLSACALVLSLAGVLTACGHSGATDDVVIGGRTLVESTYGPKGERPQWTYKIPKDDQNLYFVGRSPAMDAANGEKAALASAREDAATQLANYLNNTVDKVYQEVQMSGASSENTGSYIENMMRSYLQKVKAQGLKDAEIYYEAYQVQTTATEKRLQFYGFVLQPVDKQIAHRLWEESVTDAVKKAEKAKDERARAMLKSMTSLLGEFNQ